MMNTSSAIEIQRPRESIMSSFSSFGDMNSDEFDLSNNNFNTATNSSSSANAPLTSMGNVTGVSFETNGDNKNLLNQIRRKNKDLKDLVANFWQPGSSSCPNKIGGISSNNNNNNFLNKIKSEETLCGGFHPIDISSEKNNNSNANKQNAKWAYPGNRKTSMSGPLFPSMDLLAIEKQLFQTSSSNNNNRNITENNINGLAPLSKLMTSDVSESSILSSFSNAATRVSLSSSCSNGNSNDCTNNPIVTTSNNSCLGNIIINNNNGINNSTSNHIITDNNNNNVCNSNIGNCNISHVITGSNNNNGCNTNIANNNSNYIITGNNNSNGCNNSIDNSSSSHIITGNNNNNGCNNSIVNSNSSHIITGDNNSKHLITDDSNNSGSNSSCNSNNGNNKSNNYSCLPNPIQTYSNGNSSDCLSKNIITTNGCNNIGSNDYSCVPNPTPIKTYSTCSNKHYTQSKIVNSPGPYDIVCGRNSGAFNFIGNRRFRVTIEMNLQRYIDSPTREDKTNVIKSIVWTLHEEIGARFLKKELIKKSDKVNGGTRKTAQYTVMTAKQAREKVGHALRDLVISARKEQQEGQEEL